MTTGESVFNTTSFVDATEVATVARASGIATVRIYQGGLLDVGSRRLWVRARPSSDPAVLESSQIVKGDIGQASDLIRKGGWAAVSESFASEHHLRIGSHFNLPTPSGALRLGVAALMTNSGWPAGAITLNNIDYRRYWDTTGAAALKVTLKPGVSFAEGRRAVQAALRPGNSLQVQTVSESEAQADASARQGLKSLGQISTLLLITGALAIAASLSAVIWQRRGRLAAMKTWGYDYLQLLALTAP